MNTKNDTQITQPKSKPIKAPKKREFDYEDVDASLRFREEKKRQKLNNWRKYLDYQDEDE